MAASLDRLGAHGVKLKYLLTCGCGFATDVVLLQLGMGLGLQPAWARVISLFCAMQVTFWINGLVVFKTLDRRRIPQQWAGYMVTNAFGNLCNYLVFTTLLSLHRPVLSNPILAVAVGGLTAVGINYAACRFWVFRHHHRPDAALIPRKVEP